MNLNLEKISIKHLPILKKHYTYAQERWAVPYYWQTPPCLLSEGLFISLYKGCVLLLTHTCCGYYTMKLKVPPLSLIGDLDKEREVSKELLDEGVSILSYDKDLPIEPLYGSYLERAINSKQLMTYRTKDFSGKRRAKVRGMLNKYNSLVDSGEITVSIQNIFTDDLWDLFKDWSFDRFGKIKNSFECAKACEDVFDFHIIVHKQGNEVFHYSTLFPYGKHTGMVIHDVGMSRYFYPKLNFSMLGDYEMFRQFPNLDYVNVGSSRNKAVAFAKSRLDHEFVPLVKLKPSHHMDKQTWEKHRPLQK